MFKAIVNRIFKGERGFTLIELLAVMSIVAVLAGVVSTSISGTGEVGAMISVVASDGVDSTMAFMVTVDSEANWSIDGIDVSALANGIIPYTATATDDAGNVSMDEITAEKISVAPLAMMDDEDDDAMLTAVASAVTAANDDPDAIDEVLALEDDWMPDFD